MNIRLMRTDDYDAVYGLWMSCTGMGLNNADDSKEGFAAFLKRNPETCFVAECKNPKELVGVILAGNDGRRGYIYHTAVHPDYRKSGIGSRLVEAALTALKKLGIHKAALAFPCGTIWYTATKRFRTCKERIPSGYPFFAAV